MDLRAKRINEAIKASKLSYAELEKITGVSKSALQRYASGETKKIPVDCIEKIASATNVTSEYLMGWDYPTDETERKGIKIPVLGIVQAGIPIEAVEDILDYEEISPETASQGEHFALRVRGSSMEPRIMEGDVVIVRKQPDISGGDIAVILVNGDSATVKKVVKQKNGISLVPFNPMFEPTFYSCDEIKSLPVTVIGKVVELRGKL